MITHFSSFIDSHSVANVATEGIPEETETEELDVTEEDERSHDSHGLNEERLRTEGGYDGGDVEEDQHEESTPGQGTIEFPHPPALVALLPPVPHQSTRPEVSAAEPAPPVAPRSLPQVPPHASHSPVRSLPTPPHVGSSPMRSLPTPPQLVPQAEEAEEPSESESENISGQRTRALPASQQPSDDDEDNDSPRPVPLRLSPNEEEENTDNESAPLPVPHRRSLSQEDNSTHPPPPSYASSRPLRAIPAPPALSTPTSDVESDYDEVLPTRPRHRPGTPGTPPANEVPLIVPPPVSDEPTKKPEPSPLRQSTYLAHGQHEPSPPPADELPTPLAPTLPDQEIWDDEEGGKSRALSQS